MLQSQCSGTTNCSVFLPRQINLSLKSADSELLSHQRKAVVENKLVPPSIRSNLYLKCLSWSLIYRDYVLGCEVIQSAQGDQVLKNNNHN
jgi:hypothetical protein